MEVEHRREPSDTGDDEFRATAETDCTVRINTAEADFEFGIGDNTVDIDGQAVVKTAQGAQVTSHKVMARYLVFGGDIGADFLGGFRIGEGTVRTASDDEPNLRFRDTGFGEFAEEKGDDLGGRCRAAQVIDNDGGTLFALRHCCDAGCADGFGECLRELGIGERGAIFRAQYLHFPTGREIQRQFFVAIPCARVDCGCVFHKCSPFGHI